MSPFAADSVAVYGFLALAALFMPFLLAARGLTIALDQFAMASFMFAMLIWLALCLRGRGLSRIASALEAFAVFHIACFTLSLLSFAIAASDMPYVDTWLAEADRILVPGFDWRSTMLSFAHSGQPLIIANSIYTSIQWQAQFALVVLSLTGRSREAWHFLLSWITTLCIVMLIFTFTPAVGAYTYYGITPAEIPEILDPTPWRETLEGLRSGTLRFIDLASLDGIVTVPSFHAGAGILLAYAFWGIRLLRWPFAVLNGLMIVTAVPMGGHYVVDLVVGIIVAVAGISAATRIMDRIETLRRRPQVTVGS